jgi:hypothetical protein
VKLPSTTGDVKVHLYDCIGYGDFVDNEHCFETIRSNLECRINEWRSLEAQKMEDEVRCEVDDRIHCLFYFIRPHYFKEIDYQFFDELSDIVPIIPIVSKADAMTSEERSTFLQQISAQLAEMSAVKSYNVVYDFKEDMTSYLNEPRSAASTGTNPAAESSIKEEPSNSDETSSTFSMQSAGLSQSFYKVGEFLAREQTYESEENTSDGSFGQHPSPIIEHVVESESMTSTSCPGTPPRSSCGSFYRIENTFAVISSRDRMRSYPWGTIEIDEINISDFRRLQILIFEEGEHIRGMRIATQQRAMSFYQSLDGQLSYIIFVSKRQLRGLGQLLRSNEMMIALVIILFVMMHAIYHQLTTSYLLMLVAAAASLWLLSTIIAKLIKAHYPERSSSTQAAVTTSFVTICLDVLMIALAFLVSGMIVDGLHKAKRENITGHLPEASSLKRGNLSSFINGLSELFNDTMSLDKPAVADDKHREMSGFLKRFRKSSGI